MCDNGHSAEMARNYVGRRRGPRLLDNNPDLAESVLLARGWAAALNAMQVELLTRWLLGL